MSVYHKSHWISCNIDDALGWSYIRVVRSRFYSHHMPIMLLFPLQLCEKLEGGPPCNSMPFWCGFRLTILKFSYSLVRHYIRQYSCLNKLTLFFCLGSSHPSLKVHEVKCVPGDPALTCPVLFKGSRSLLLLAWLYVAYCTSCPYLVRRYLVFC